MAKNHVYEMMSVYVANVQQTLKNQVFRVRSRIHFSCTHDDTPFTINGDGKKVKMSHDYNAMFDLEFGFKDAMEILLKQIIVYLQNKKLRAMTPESATKWFKDHDPVKYEDIFIGAKRTVIKQMSPEEVKEKCLTDPVFKAEFLKSLGL